MSASKVMSRHEPVVDEPIDEVGAELKAAEAEAADVERRYAKALAALERAVADADVPAVMRLRGEAEVILPRHLGAARIRLLAARIAVAEQVVAGSAETIREAEERAAAARRELEEASERLNQATGGFHAANNRLSSTKTDAGRSLQRLQRLRDEHAAYIAGHEQDQQRRLRLLAGLPDLEEVSG
jgi:chromosome segregation ATPase